MIPTLPPSLVIAACALATTVPTSPSDDPARIVFVRGGLFTTGHISGSGLDSLSSIFNVLTTQGNHGYSQLAAALAADGYAVDEIAEGDLSTPGPADLLGAFGSADVLAFTSNNVVYGASDAEALRTWVCEGGGAFFSSDGDWGQLLVLRPRCRRSTARCFDGRVRAVETVEQRILARVHVHAIERAPVELGRIPIDDRVEHRPVARRREGAEARPADLRIEFSADGEHRVAQGLCFEASW